MTTKQTTQNKKTTVKNKHLEHQNERRKTESTKSVNNKKQTYINPMLATTTTTCYNKGGQAPHRNMNKQRTPNTETTDIKTRTQNATTQQWGMRK